MPTHCSGTQGTHLRVSGNGITPVEIVTGGGAISEQTTSVIDGYAVWGVTIGYSGSSSGRFMGNHGKRHSASFIVNNVRISSTQYSIRLALNTAPNTTIASTTAGVTGFIRSVVFSHGDPVRTNYRTVVKSPSGSTLFDRSSDSGHFSVSELTCGCNDSDCQMGTFPTDFCCTNCAQQSAILSSILSALNSR